MGDVPTLFFMFLFLVLPRLSPADLDHASIGKVW